jgi:hypothetical protein
MCTASPSPPLPGNGTLPASALPAGSFSTPSVGALCGTLRGRPRFLGVGVAPSCGPASTWVRCVLVLPAGSPRGFLAAPREFGDVSLPRLPLPSSSSSPASDDKPRAGWRRGGPALSGVSLAGDICAESLAGAWDTLRGRPRFLGVGETSSLPAGISMLAGSFCFLPLPGGRPLPLFDVTAAACSLPSEREPSLSPLPAEVPGEESAEVERRWYFLVLEGG